MRSGYESVLAPQALEFLRALHERFNDTRKGLLARRQQLQARIDQGWTPGFPEETQPIRDAQWQVRPIPSDLLDRRVEITGPVDRKMVINALNSGAKVFMADFEDATSPTWCNVIDGQINLTDAIGHQIDFQASSGKWYRLNDQVATIIVRPRGWHLDEKHIVINGEPLSGSLMDFGLYFYRNAQTLLDKGSGPYFYLPKLEGYLEARLWAEVFAFAEDYLAIPHGSIKATVLIETILGALEMDEILYELRDYGVGLNAGRWDYIFSAIKKFRQRPAAVLPDRNQVTMTVPFMRAYTELLVKTCHRRGAFAMGGMAAFIPNRKDPERTQLALGKVREDKVREARDGCDGTWVAHPDLVSVAMEVFEDVLRDQPNQLAKQRPDVHVDADDLLTFSVPEGTITEDGLRNNVHVAVRYIDEWLQGQGAVAIFNLMEDAATAEIARAQIWQWIANHSTLTDGRQITEGLVRDIEAQEVEKMRHELGNDEARLKNLQRAVTLFESVALSPHFPEFLTIPAYSLLN